MATVKNEQESIKLLLEKVLDNQAKMLAYLTQTSKKGISRYQTMFPLETEEQMQTVERFSESNKAEMVCCNF